MDLLAELQPFDRVHGQLDDGEVPAGDGLVTGLDAAMVRLGPGIQSWEELVRQSEPDVRKGLQALTPIRTNRLGIVDLALPDRDRVADPNGARGQRSC